MQINKLGDDLYLFIGDTYESNSSVFVAGDQVLLVDACRNDPLSDHSRARNTVQLESSTRPSIGSFEPFRCSDNQGTIARSLRHHAASVVGRQSAESKRVALVWSATRGHYSKDAMGWPGGTRQPARLNYRTCIFTSLDGGR